MNNTMNDYAFYANSIIDSGHYDTYKNCDHTYNSPCTLTLCKYHMHKCALRYGISTNNIGFYCTWRRVYEL